MNPYLSTLNSLLLPSIESNELSAVSVFSGGGGLDLGLSLAGFSIKYANDEVKCYCDTISYNFPDCITETQDIVKVTGDSIKELIKSEFVSLLCGGSPCQSFSILGQRKSFSDSRGKLVFEFIRLINELQPEAFIFENVPGILTINKGEDWKRLLATFESTNYHTYPDILNAADYGVPQVRKRLFIVGFRKYVEFNYPVPIRCAPSKNTGLSNPILPEWLPSKLALENVDGLPNHNIRPHGEKVQNRYKTIPVGGRDQVDHTQKIHPEKPSGTILVGSQNGGGRPHIHPYFPRHITVREAARLQSFPDWYKFMGTQTAQYRQVGNAVPPLLAFAIGKSIKESLLLQKLNGDNLSPTTPLEWTIQTK